MSALQNVLHRLRHVLDKTPAQPKDTSPMPVTVSAYEQSAAAAAELADAITKTMDEIKKQAGRRHD
jgi:hypothetical protein